MASADKVPMLAEGHRKLNDELRRLKNEERPAIVASTWPWRSLAA
jgi:transcription elongation factor GreA